MNTTSHLLGANLRAHSRRYIATGIAIAISVIFVTLAVNFATGMKTTLTNQLISSVHGSAVVVSGGESHVNLSGAAELIRQVDGVKQAVPSVQAFVQLSNGETRTSQTVMNTLPAPFEQAQVISGSMPTTTDEILLTENAAAVLNVTVGDSIGLKPMGSDQASVSVRIVGISPTRYVGTSDSYMTFEGLDALGLTSTTSVVLVQADAAFGGDSATPKQQTQLADKVRAALSDPAAQAAVPNIEDANIDGHDQAVKAIESDAGEIFGSIFLGFLVFPAIAGVVALIVVHSTFQVLLHQRKREMALLRAIGARSGQLRSLIVAETLAVGAVASAIAIAVGSALSAVVLKSLKMAPSVLSALSLMSPVMLAVVFAAGTLLTVLVGVRPALGAARISPMAALSPVEDSPLRSHRLPVIRLGVAAVALVVSLGGMYFFASHEDDGQRFLGLVALSFVALVAALALIAVALPFVTRLLGGVSGSMLSQMARENTARNPRRTGATGTAIIIGVTLMVTMMVGATSMKATLSAELDNRRPMDFEVIVSTQADADTVESKVRSLEHVVSTVQVEQVYTTVGSLGEMVVAGQPDLTPVMHQPKPLLKAGQMALANEDLAPVGQAYTVEKPGGGSATFTITDQRSYLSAEAVVPAAELDAFDGTRTTVILAMIDDPTKASDVASKIESIDGVEFASGSAVERQMYAEMISVVLNVVLALVGVSVLVSVVGVSNTLNLSVRERTRENGLLRALGLTRRQMRRLLTVEAVLIALTATAIGTGLGVFFAWVGMYALPMRIAEIHLALPWAQLGAVIAVALLSAIVASVLPGRKAAKVSPVEALATL